MEPFKFKGFVHQIGQTQSFPSGFAKRTVVLVEDPNKQYKDYVAFDFTTTARAKVDHTKDPDGFNPGDPVEITFFPSANENRKSPGQWFSSLKAVKIERAGAVKDLTPGYAPQPATPDYDASGDMEDMPF